MKKMIILGLAAATTLLLPAIATADYVVRSTNHYFLYKTSTYVVDTFTDSGNRCYVTTSKLTGYAGGEVTAISCVRTD